VADLKRTVAIIFEGQDRASQSVAEIDRKLQGLGQEAGGAAAEVGKIDKELEKVGKGGTQVDQVAKALKGLAASLVVKDFIDANAQFERFISVMTAVTGTTEGARQEFEFIRGVSERLGVEVRAVSGEYAKFAAATKGTALEGDGARVIFEGFAGTLSRMGASTADISGAFVQLSQGVSKGRFELQDLKSIAERVPGFFLQFANSLGITTAELFDLISAGKIGNVEILKFANDLNQGLQGVEFEGFTQSLARARNAINDAFLFLGNAGVFDVFIKGLQLTTAAVIGAVSTFTLLGEIIGAVFAKLTLGRDFNFGEAVEEAFNKAANAVRPARDAVFNVNEELEQTGFNAVDAGQKLLENLGAGSNGAKELEAAARLANEQLKALGVDPRKLAAPLAQVERLFEDLLRNPAVRGDQILAGLEGALKRISDQDTLAQVGASIVTAFAQGKLTADEFARATILLEQAQDKLSGTLPAAEQAGSRNAASLERQARESKNAEKAARDYALEMEKLASNERIKFIEAKVSLDIARAEADAKRVVAAFESINTTVNSTGDLLGSLFGLFKDFDNLSFGAIRQIERQIELENKRRDEALKLQRELTLAQIEQIRAQTRNLDKGDALIKVDGSGLQPHLEAFMFEILRAIQVRVNQDGLGLLLNA